MAYRQSTSHFSLCEPQSSIMALNSLQKCLIEMTWYSRSSLILNANSQSSNYIVKITEQTAQKCYVEILHDVTTSRIKSTFFSGTFIILQLSFSEMIGTKGTHKREKQCQKQLQRCSSLFGSALLNFHTRVICLIDFKQAPFFLFTVKQDSYTGFKISMILSASCALNNSGIQYCIV